MPRAQNPKLSVWRGPGGPLIWQNEPSGAHDAHLTPAGPEKMQKKKKKRLFAMFPKKTNKKLIIKKVKINTFFEKKKKRIIKKTAFWRTDHQKSRPFENG